MEKEQVREKRVMTEDLRRKLAGFISFSNDATIDFPPEEYLEKDKDENFTIPQDLHAYFPTYAIRCYTVAENEIARGIIDAVQEDTEHKNIEERFKSIREIVRVVISGWKNNFDLGTLRQIEYKKDPQGGCDKELFEKIPDWQIWPIFSFANKISCITLGEKLSLK